MSCFEAECDAALLVEGLLSVFLADIQYAEPDVGLLGDDDSHHRDVLSSFGQRIVENKLLVS